MTRDNHDDTHGHHTGPGFGGGGQPWRSGGPGANYNFLVINIEFNINFDVPNAPEVIGEMDVALGPAPVPVQVSPTISWNHRIEVLVVWWT